MEPHEIAAKLIERRSDLRTLLGQRYETQMAQYRELVRIVAEDEGNGNMLDVSLKMAQKALAAGHNSTTANCLLVAGMELVETE